MSTPARSRLLDLLADRALEGLGPAEEAELAQLLAEHPDVDPRELDLTAALIAASGPEEPAEPLSDELRSRIEKLALSTPPFNGKTVAQPIQRGNLAPASRFRRVLVPWAGWVAACFLAAVMAFWMTNREPTVMQKFERFLAADGAWVRAEGTPPDPKSKPQVTGEIYWSGARQEGYMKLRGLPMNDPTRNQYQLWIFDKQRDQRYPVDGGIFNVNSTGEVVIPMDARIRVHDASLFVITREPPGGVVVSDRKEIVLVAALR